MSLKHECLPYNVIDSVPNRLYYFLQLCKYQVLELLLHTDYLYKLTDRLKCLGVHCLHNRDKGKSNGSGEVGHVFRGDHKSLDLDGRRPVA